MTKIVTMYGARRLIEKCQIIEECYKITDPHGKTSIEQCQIIELPKITDHRGNLTFIENNKHIPFEIKRVYYLYDVPGGAERAGHAHKALHQFLVAMSGSFDVVLDNGTKKQNII